ncbi:MAG: hypothetical protein LAO07_14230, partial [Acidobacteriia bacterium]|nr:hypothetical protein [Terriglobia bacterium]
MDNGNRLVFAEPCGVYLTGGITGTILEGSGIFQTALSTASSVYGVEVWNAPGTVIRKNKIYNLFAPSGNAIELSTIEGILYGGASGVSMTVSIYNN